MKLRCVIILVSKSSKYNFSLIIASLFKISWMGAEEARKKILGNSL